MDGTVAAIYNIGYVKNDCVTASFSQMKFVSHLLSVIIFRGGASLETPGSERGSVRMSVGVSL